MNGPPAPGRISGEPDRSYEKYREYARSGGYDLESGRFTPRPSLAEMAPRLGVSVKWCQALSARWKWLDRVATWDSSMARYLAAQSVGPGQLAGILRKVVDSLSEDDLMEAKASEKIALAKFAADQLEATREKEDSRPLVIHGLPKAKLATLTPEDRTTLESILRKLL